MKAKKVVPQERDPRLKGPIQFKDLPAEGKPPDPPKRPLSKDELIDLLEQSSEEMEDAANRGINQFIPTLLFLENALLADDEHGCPALRIRGTDYDYCHSSAAVGDLLGLMAAHLHEHWNKIDASHIRAFGEVRRSKEAMKPTVRKPRA